MPGLGRDAAACGQDPVPSVCLLQGPRGPSASSSKGRPLAKAWPGPRGFAGMEILLPQTPEPGIVFLRLSGGFQPSRCDAARQLQRGL